MNILLILFLKFNLTTLFDLDLFVLMFLLHIWFFYLYTVTNLYTLIFCFEILTSIIFSILLNTYFMSKTNFYLNSYLIYE